ncbi:MAG TPA: ATP synthase F1 subunit epsilon [Gemmatimonadaceae bacterium]|nr:ATP synthase F1 subunit epsilon [Gemmatimonadaceae bacterium]
MSDLTIAVISPEQTVYEGTAHTIVAPAYDGEVGILPGHAPILTLLGKGVLRIGDKVHINVRGGFMQVADDVVRVVAEYAERG